MFEIPKFAFVVDTEQYAGNFERELCAYATGVVGECQVGEDEASLYAQEQPGDNPFEDIILRLPDEHGCHRPVLTWPTPGWFNDGMGGHFRAGQKAEAQQHYQEQCLEYSRSKPYTDQASNDKHERRWKEQATKTFGTYPAHLSIAICFSESPSDALIARLCERASAFCAQERLEEDGCLIHITGFRMLSFKITETEIDISQLYQV